MMFVCNNCFSDNELVSRIVSNNKLGNCDFCGCKNVNIIELIELYDFFIDLFDNLQTKRKGKKIINIIQNNFILFNDKKCGSKIIDFVLRNIKSPFNNSNDFVDFSDEILENVNYWGILKIQLSNERRFLIDINKLIEDYAWDGFFETKTYITNEDKLFRARLHKKADDPAYDISNMSSPKAEIASAGRANPLGIPYLYLSDREDTVLYEIRATYLDEVSIGTFYKKSDKEDILISDFTEIPSLYGSNDRTKKIQSTLLKQLISKDLSKPIRRYDSELEYIPTQFICEFIKIITNVKGIKFKSSLHKLGNNLVIFDKDLMECTSVKKVKISSIKIKSKQLKSQ